MIGYDRDTVVTGDDDTEPDTPVSRETGHIALIPFPIEEQLMRDSASFIHYFWVMDIINSLDSSMSMMTNEIDFDLIR